jgi:nucleotide-binding universal stress UspA family protein
MTDRDRVHEDPLETFAREFTRHHQPGQLTIISRILVPTDFSRGSLHAFRYAEELTRRFGAELILVHVGDPLSVSDLPGAGELSGRRELDRALALVRERDYRVRGVLRRGNPTDEIVKAAAAERADLIVMGTHGRTGLKHALMGSVAESVVRNAPCPVLTVRHAE